MDLIVKSRNGRISERQRSHIEEKLGKLERHLEYARSATVEVSSESRRNQEVKRLQVTLVGEHGVILRAEQSHEDLYTAVDEVQDILQRQIKRYKEKHWRRGKLRRKGGEFVSPEPGVTVEPIIVADGETEETEDAPRHIVRVKEFALKPMFSDEAVEQMELLNHSFFIFRDADTSQISVVYRRRDGHYGLIIPEAG
ncbi:MAG: ribosome-associated translation inhibitor RaiA [Chloroflexaceae bacterium]|nr:ribosome-associated translation inhibitor RaiA [Chloroflexaceae bacterium]